ncbi:hypothetical protein [Clavibacter californiensis]|uniref:Uncharacterized protein n=1 Tax=Clavibacter californiensis TaxID=1401995 RepID=A0ABX9N9W2_9MICO|nr:hypothetical protein [Clavibacter californiensis]RII94554.1 hypothetical protein DZF98_01155 [Clavibacter californiensis]UKF78892.1 hypothetical protein FGD68_08710 [Clavibacter californiensis]
MITVPTRTAPSKSTSTIDCRDLETKMISSRREVQYLTKNGTCEKMLARLVYRPANGTLYVEEFGGGTKEDRDRVTNIVCGLLDGDDSSWIPWSQCPAPDVEDGTLQAQVGYVVPWPESAPSWATRVEVQPREEARGGERIAVFGSAALRPWSVCVERTDYLEVDGTVQSSAPGIRVTLAGDDAADDDIRTPAQARRLAAQLIDAADLLERVLTGEAEA